MRYALNKNTDRTWFEICDTQAPHVNGIGNPVARVVPELADSLLVALEKAEALADVVENGKRWLKARLDLVERHDDKGDLQHQLRACERDLEDAIAIYTGTE